MHRLLRKLLAMLRGRDPSSEPNRRAATGKLGEAVAARFLRKRGYQVLARNYATRLGEIDLVVFRGGTVAFVEVRSVNEPAGPDPALTVTPAKQRRVVRAAEEYCTRNGLRGRAALRFDVIAVRFPESGRPELRHYENAFESSRRGF